MFSSSAYGMCWLEGWLLICCRSVSQGDVLRKWGVESSAAATARVLGLIRSAPQPLCFPILRLEIDDDVCWISGIMRCGLLDLDDIVDERSLCCGDAL